MLTTSQPYRGLRSVPRLQTTRLEKAALGEPLARIYFMYPSRGLYSAAVLDNCAGLSIIVRCVTQLAGQRETISAAGYRCIMTNAGETEGYHWEW